MLVQKCFKNWRVLTSNCHNLLFLREIFQVQGPCLPMFTPWGFYDLLFPSHVVSMEMQLQSCPRGQVYFISMKHHFVHRRLTAPLQKSTITSPGFAMAFTAVARFSSCSHFRPTLFSGNSTITLMKCNAVIPQLLRTLRLLHNALGFSVNLLREGSVPYSKVLGVLILSFIVCSKEDYFLPC